jgi:hypothetical protein
MNVSWLNHWNTPRIISLGTEISETSASEGAWSLLRAAFKLSFPIAGRI